MAPQIKRRHDSLIDTDFYASRGAKLRGDADQTDSLFADEKGEQFCNLGNKVARPREQASWHVVVNQRKCERGKSMNRDRIIRMNQQGGRTDMTGTTEIKAALERTVNAFTRRPGAAQGTYQVTAKLEDGLMVTVREGDWKTKVDMPAALGGEGVAPTPGVLGRAALTGCIAIGVRMEALQSALPLESVELSLECDCDDRGLFGLADVPPGYEAFRVTISVLSSAPEQEVRAVIDRTLARSPWLDVFKRSQNIRTEVVVTSPVMAG